MTSVVLPLSGKESHTAGKSGTSHLSACATAYRFHPVVPVITHGLARLLVFELAVSMEPVDGKQPKVDLSRFVKWPRYIRIQRQRKVGGVDICVTFSALFILPCTFLAHLLAYIFIHCCRTYFAMLRFAFLTTVVVYFSRLTPLSTYLPAFLLHCLEFLALHCSHIFCRAHFVLHFFYISNFPPHFLLALCLSAFETNFIGRTNSFINEMKRTLQHYF